MTEGQIWAVVFGGSLLLSLVGTNRAEKNLVDDFDERAEKMPTILRWVYGLLHIYPPSVLKETGQRWQLFVYILMVPLLISALNLS